MWAAGATRLATADRLLAEMDLGMVVSVQGARSVQLRPGQDEQAAQIVLIEVLDRIEQVAIEGHRGTGP